MPVSCALLPMMVGNEKAVPQECPTVAAEQAVTTVAAAEQAVAGAAVATVVAAEQAVAGAAVALVVAAEQAVADAAVAYALGAGTGEVVHPHQVGQ